jgi:hypothetical protein
MLRVLIPIARSGSEELNSRRVMFSLSLRTPSKTAELSNVREDVPGVEKVPSRLLSESNTERKAV